MPISRDPDTLRVPAFMRKRSIASRLKRPLLLTALDRRRAAAAARLYKKKKAKKKSVKSSQASFLWPFPDSELKRTVPVQAKKFRPVQSRKVKLPQAKATHGFSAPLLETKILPIARKQKNIGTLTHYYDKIQVGVIKLTAILSIGDCIRYETETGPYEQVVESMEINREPVFKAGKGKEIGMKLHALPRVGCAVFLAA